MPVPVISVAQMREWENATWASGQTESEVIRQVGRLLGRRIEALTQPGSLVVVFAGKGHNGDDARAASETVADREVHVVFFDSTLL